MSALKSAWVWKIALGGASGTLARASELDMTGLGITQEMLRKRSVRDSDCDIDYANVMGDGDGDGDCNGDEDGVVMVMEMGL